MLVQKRPSWPHSWRLRRRVLHAIVHDRGNPLLLRNFNDCALEAPEPATLGRTSGGSAAASLEISKRLRRSLGSLLACDGGRELPHPRRSSALVLAWRCSSNGEPKAKSPCFQAPLDSSSESA